MASSSWGNEEEPCITTDGCWGCRAWIPDARDRQDVACGLAAELVGAVAARWRSPVCVQLGGLDEHGGFFGPASSGCGPAFALGTADAVFFAGRRFPGCLQAAQLAFHGGADLVGHGHHLLGHHVHVVVEGRRGLPSLISEPSIITEPEAPGSARPWQTSGVVPWSWCISPGMWGYPGSRLDQVLDEGLTGGVLAGNGALACRRSRGPSSAADITAWTCSRLFTLKAGCHSRFQQHGPAFRASRSKGMVGSVQSFERQRPGDESP